MDPDTGRLHTTFHQTVAATGRLSSSDPNLQNIPVRTALGAQIRQCFGAEAGNLLVVADYSQIELHIMAFLSAEPALLEALARGEDIHRRTAAEVFGMPADQVDTTHRRYAKAVNFGIMYGISAFGLSQNLGIEREEAAAYIQRYFERLPRVKAFIEATIETARRQGYATTVFGRRRPIPELASANFQERSLGERLAVNSVIQGSAADIIKVAMIRCHDRLAKDFPASRLVLQVHDELVFEVPGGGCIRGPRRRGGRDGGRLPYGSAAARGRGSGGRLAGRQVALSSPYWAAHAAVACPQRPRLSSLCRLLFPGGCVYYPAREPCWGMVQLCIVSEREAETTCQTNTPTTQ